MSFLCFCKISEWKSQWTDGFLKELDRFLKPTPTPSHDFVDPPHPPPRKYGFYCHHTPYPLPTTSIFWIVPQFYKVPAPPPQNLAISTLKMYLNIYQKTTFALNMWSNSYFNEFHTEDVFFRSKTKVFKLEKLVLISFPELIFS